VESKYVAKDNKMESKYVAKDMGC